MKFDKFHDPTRYLRRRSQATLAVGTALLTCSPVFGLNVFRDGRDAESKALAGFSVAETGSVIEAMSSNPAMLAGFDAFTADANLDIAVYETSFSNATNTDASSDIESGAVPDFAVAWRPGNGNGRLTLGFGMSADVALSTRYTLLDPPGGLDGVTSYGRREHSTLFAAVRGSVGAGVQLTEQLSIGASVGAVWNRNELKAPYIFQGNHALQGMKALLDLYSEGWGITGQIGLLYRPSDRLTLGLSYRPETTMDTEGDVNGNAAAQLQSLGGPFAAARPDYRYDTQIDATIPAVLSGGGHWQAFNNVAFTFQIDWIRSGDNYDALVINLTNGNNADFNALIGSDAFVESSPLDWDDQIVTRIGVDYQMADEWNIRAGFAYGENPIGNTATPLTASISEKVLGVGLFRTSDGPLTFGFAYQWVLPNTLTVDDSALLGGEYDNSEFTLEGHWFSLGGSYRF